MGTLVSFSSSFLAKLFSSPSSFSNSTLKPSSFCCVFPQMFFKRDSREKKAMQGADAYQANPCLWLWGPLHFSDLVPAGGFTSGSCWAWSCFFLPLDPTQPPVPIPGLPAHPQGLETGGLAMVSLCRCGGEKGSIILSDK